MGGVPNISAAAVVTKTVTPLKIVPGIKKNQPEHFGTDIEGFAKLDGLSLIDTQSTFLQKSHGARNEHGQIFSIYHGLQIYLSSNDKPRQDNNL